MRLIATRREVRQPAYTETMFTMKITRKGAERDRGAGTLVHEDPSDANSILHLLTFGVRQWSKPASYDYSIEVRGEEFIRCLIQMPPKALADSLARIKLSPHDAAAIGELSKTLAISLFSNGKP